MDKTISLLAGVLFVVFSGQPGLLLAKGCREKTDTIPSRLLYVVEGSQNYLIPYIEQKLKNLRRPDSDILLYETVSSLNTLAQKTSIEGKMIDIFSENYSRDLAAAPADRNDTLLKYSQLMSSFQSVLAIKVNSFQELLEFQFTLYDVVKQGNAIRYRNSSSLFVDPKAPHYQADIIRTLNQVFDMANRRPRFNLTANIKKTDGVYFLTPEDTLLLEPIIEDESTEDDRIYFWNQDIKDTVQANIDASTRNQSLKNLRPGRYTLYFRISNGISYSTMDTIHLTVYNRPILKIFRPNDQSLFRSFKDRLVIQEYVFSNMHVDYFSIYTMKLDSSQFIGPKPDVFVKICDKSGTTYAGQLFPFGARSYGSARFNSGSDLIIADVNNMDVPFKSVQFNKYSISFVARNQDMQSREVKDDLGVFRRRPVSLIYDAMIFPVAKSRLFDSWINVSAGLDFHLNDFLSLSAVFGTNVAKQSFRHYFSNFVANIHLYRGFEGGPAIFIDHDNSAISAGFKISYTLFAGTSGNIKLGGSYYNQGNTDLFAIHYTGNVFFNH